MLSRPSRVTRPATLPPILTDRRELGEPLDIIGACRHGVQRGSRGCMQTDQRRSSRGTESFRDSWGNRARLGHPTKPKTSIKMVPEVGVEPTRS